MKLDMTKEISGLNGEPLKTPTYTPDGKAIPDGGKPVTLRMVIQNALLNPVEGDQNLDGTAKWKLWRMAQRTEADTADFESGEEVATIKLRISKMYDQIILGPVFDYFEQIDS